MAARWYVIWTEARAEKLVASRLEAIGHAAWLPTYTARRKWSDRWKEVTLPLFPGYLFAQEGPWSWHELLRVPGVLTLVKVGSVPVLLTSEYIAQLQRAIATPEAQAEPVELPPDFSAGDEVVVLDGPLAGVRGVVRDMQSRRTLVIWIEAVGRGVACTIGAAAVRKVGAVA
ncbi:MAG: transcription termination/antitermination NusG family protein [Gemmatimonadaceae bacterium]